MTVFNFLTFVALLSLARAGVLYEQTQVTGTVYYDCSDQDSCASQFGKDWSTGVNEAISACEPNTGGRKYSEVGSNRIVAFNADMVSADKDYWCGREVKIYDASGKLYEDPEGPLFVWDGCGACTAAPIIDVSASALTALNGGLCNNPANNGNMPTGLKYQIMDNYIWKRDGAGSAAPPAAPKGGPAVAATTPVTSPAQTSAAASGDGSACTGGKYRCSGLETQVCNQVSQSSMGWQTISTCQSSCKMDGNGVVPSCT